MKATNHPFLLLAVLMFTSCSRHSAVWPQLLEAEQLLETDLQSAGAMIDSLDATPLEGEDAALYAILKTQADWKRYHPLTSDSLPRLATDYYGTPYRKNYHAAMAWYSLGCYYTEQKDDAGAIESYLRAKDLYPDTLVRYYALCEQNLGKHYYIHQMHDLSVPVLKMYKNHPATMSDSSMMADADYLLGIAYIRRRSFREAEQSFHAALDNPYVKSAVKRDIYFYLAKILYYEEQSYGASLSLVEKNIAMSTPGQGSGASWLLKGEILLSTQQLDSACQCLHRAINLSNDIYTHCQAYKQLLNIAYSTESMDSLPVYQARYDSLMSAIYLQTRPDDIEAVRRQHKLETELHQRDEQLRTTVLYVLLAISIVLILVLLIKAKKAESNISLWKKTALIRQETVMLLSYASADDNVLENEASEYDDAITCDENNEPIPLPLSSEGSVVHKRIERIEIGRKLFSHEHEASLIPRDARDFKKGSYLRQDEILMLRKSVGAIFADLKIELLAECPDLSVDELEYCGYVMLGLSSRQIAYCINITRHAVNCRKSRLLPKLTPEWRQVLFGLCTDENKPDEIDNS